MKRPSGLSDPNSATATVVFAPSGTDIGAASEPREVLTHEPFGAFSNAICSGETGLMVKSVLLVHCFSCSGALAGLVLA